MITLQQILDALAEGGDVAALLSAPDVDTTALEALEREALDAFDGLRQGDVSDDDLRALETLADGVTAIRTESTRRETVQQERQATLNELADRISPPAPADVENAEDAPVEGEPAPVEAEEAPVEVEQERELVTAAGNTPARGRARVDLAAVNARRAPTPAPERTPRDVSGWSMIAAAGVPGYSPGDTYANLSDVAEACARRLEKMPQIGDAASGRQQNELVKIRKSFPDNLVASGSAEEQREKMLEAVNPSRLEGGPRSLLAAGGWCAPSETIYDLCPGLETRAGLIDVPEMVAGRGGIRWTPGPDFAAIFAGTGFLQTEAQAEAGTLKPCFEVPCEDFEEIRLDAIGICISAGLLQARAFGALIERTIEGAITAHMHRYAGQTIQRMIALSTPVALGAGLGASSHILDAVALQAADYRTANRMDPEAVLEVVMPLFAQEIIRSDIAKQNGWSDRYNVTNQQITAWFAGRNVRVQFVYNFDDAYSVVPGTFGGAVPAVTWPTSLRFMIFAAGTFLRLTQEIISLDAVYDSTLFRVNRYNALFVEDGLALARMCYSSRIVTVPVCPDGSSGEQRALACPTV